MAWASRDSRRPWISLRRTWRLCSFCTVSRILLLLFLHVGLPFPRAIIGEVPGHLHALLGKHAEEASEAHASMREDARVVPVGELHLFDRFPVAARLDREVLHSRPSPLSAALEPTLPVVISPSASTAMSGATSRLEMTARCGISRMVLDLTSGRAASEHRTTS